MERSSPRPLFGEGPEVRAGVAAIDEYLELLERRRTLLLDTIAGLPSAALSWTPLLAESSSIAMLARHCADDLRWWLVEELTGEPIGYDRDRAFAAASLDAATVAGGVEAAFDQ